MPWKETCHMDERTQFIARILAGEDTMTTVCREYGVSRKTGYKWLGRYCRDGAAGLMERSHAPLRHGQAHDVAVVQAVLATCPGCNKTLRIRADWVQQPMKCKHCGTIRPEILRRLRVGFPPRLQRLKR